MPDRRDWERPGAAEVVPGIHRIPLPLPNDGLRAVNVYAVEDGDGLVLVDSGWALAEARERLSAALADLGHELGDVQHFLVTHMHRDHYTQAVALRRDFGGDIALGAGEQACLDAMRTLDVHPDVAHMLEAGADELATALSEWHGERDLTDWDYPDRWLDDGVDLPLRHRTLRVIATPGHTRGHVVFHDRDANLLFAGDHVLPHITPSLGVELTRPPSPLRDFLTSLRIVRALPDAMLLPAHGPVTDSVHTRIDELFAHHERRLAVIAQSVDAGHVTGWDVARSITWTRRERSLDDLDLFNRILAVNETMAHLQVLVEGGEVTETTVDGVAHFARG